MLGVCSPGKTACADAGLVCVRDRDAGTELCNTLDDDCDGTVDDGFDLATDPANCGACGNGCPGGNGTGCRAGACYERDCADGVDNDSDAGADCADPACLGITCSADQLSNCGARDAGFDGGVGPDAGVDPDAGMSDGGTDAGLVIFCVPKETACDNGADDDLDGTADCADADCDGRTCASGTVCAARTCPGPG